MSGDGSGFEGKQIPADLAGSDRADRLAMAFGVSPGGPRPPSRTSTRCPAALLERILRLSAAAKGLFRIHHAPRSLRRARRQFGSWAAAVAAGSLRERHAPRPRVRSRAAGGGKVTSMRRARI
jgi:hypothetical protein